MNLISVCVTKINFILLIFTIQIYKTMENKNYNSNKPIPILLGITSIAFVGAVFGILIYKFIH
jgi:hypothetical protein